MHPVRGVGGHHHSLNRANRALLEEGKVAPAKWREYVGRSMHGALVEIASSCVADLEAWFAGSRWPFHREAQVTPEWVRTRAASGFFYGDSARSFWFLRRHGERVGVVRVFDLRDVTPLLDLRIGSAFRGRGLGTAMLDAVTDFVFEHYREIGRLGGYCRHDNVAMARVFAKCGYELEARHRRAWRVDGGEPVDALGYAILRDDWAGRKTNAPSV